MKKASESATEMVHILRYQHLNSQRRLFGGVLMQWIDEMAGIVAHRHCGATVITAAVDNLVFKKPARLEDLVVMRGRLNYTGHTSMEVQVDTYTENHTGERTLINQAYLVMVALGEDGKPAPVPQLTVESDAQRHEWQQAEKRSALRRQRREEKF